MSMADSRTLTTSHKRRRVIFAPHKGAHNITADLLKDWNVGANNITAHFFRWAIISVLRISSGRGSNQFLGLKPLGVGNVFIRCVIKSVIFQIRSWNCKIESG